MAGGMHVSRPVSGADGVGDNGFSLYALRMGVVFDEAKRQITLAQRGLDFADAEAIFAGPAFTIPDLRGLCGGTFHHVWFAQRQASRGRMDLAWR